MIFTNHVRREGNVFSRVCDSVCRGRGYPGPADLSWKRGWYPVEVTLLPPPPPHRLGLVNEKGGEGAPMVWSWGEVPCPGDTPPPPVHWLGLVVAVVDIAWQCLWRLCLLCKKCYLLSFTCRQLFSSVIG